MTIDPYATKPIVPETLLPPQDPYQQGSFQQYPTAPPNQYSNNGYYYSPPPVQNPNFAPPNYSQDPSVYANANQQQQQQQPAAFYNHNGASVNSSQYPWAPQSIGYVPPPPPPPPPPQAPRTSPAPRPPTTTAATATTTTTDQLSGPVQTHARFPIWYGPNDSSIKKKDNGDLLVKGFSVVVAYFLWACFFFFFLSGIFNFALGCGIAFEVFFIAFYPEITAGNSSMVNISFFQRKKIKKKNPILNPKSE